LAADSLQFTDDLLRPDLVEPVARHPQLAEAFERRTLDLLVGKPGDIEIDVVPRHLHASESRSRVAGCAFAQGVSKRQRSIDGPELDAGVRCLDWLQR